MPNASAPLNEDRRLSEQGNLPDGPGFDRLAEGLARTSVEFLYGRNGSGPPEQDAPGLNGRSVDLTA